MNNKNNNPFKKLYTNYHIPEGIKEKVMKEITLLKLLGEIADLFSGKMGETAIKLFKQGTNNNQ